MEKKKLVNVMKKCKYCHCVTICFNHWKFGNICDECLTEEKFIMSMRLQNLYAARGEYEKAAEWRDRTYTYRQAIGKG